MSDYLASQKTISAAFDTALEVMTPQGEKIQFNSSGMFLLQRPNEIRLPAPAAIPTLNCFSMEKRRPCTARISIAMCNWMGSSSVDQLIDTLRDRGMSVPGSRPVARRCLIEANHIGRGVIDGVECEHLAFRNQDVDWQLWVQVGAKPIPCKYVITSKAVGMAPQYTLVIRDWGRLTCRWMRPRSPSSRRREQKK